MPLKREAVPLLDTHDEWVRLTGACNTVLLEPDGSRHGLNTDVTGALMVLRRARRPRRAGRGPRRRSDRDLGAAGAGRARDAARHARGPRPGPGRRDRARGGGAPRRARRSRCAARRRRAALAGPTCWSPPCPPPRRCPELLAAVADVPLVFDVVYEPVADPAGRGRRAVRPDRAQRARPAGRPGGQPGGGDDRRFDVPVGRDAAGRRGGAGGEGGAVTDLYPVTAVVDRRRSALVRGAAGAPADRAGCPSRSRARAGEPEDPEPDATDETEPGAGGAEGAVRRHRGPAGAALEVPRWPPASCAAALGLVLGLDLVAARGAAAGPGRGGAGGDRLADPAAAHPADRAAYVVTVVTILLGLAGRTAGTLARPGAGRARAGWSTAACSSCCGSSTRAAWGTATSGCPACSGWPWAGSAGRSCWWASAAGSCSAAIVGGLLSLVTGAARLPVRPVHARRAPSSGVVLGQPVMSALYG